MESRRPESGLPRPDVVEVGGSTDRRAYPADDHSATVTYRVVRSGEIADWTPGLLSAHGPFREETLVFQLMDQVASRVAGRVANTKSRNATVSPGPRNQLFVLIDETMRFQKLAPYIRLLEGR